MIDEMKPKYYTKITINHSNAKKKIKMFLDRGLIRGKRCQGYIHYCEYFREAVSVLRTSLYISVSGANVNP